MAIVLRCQTCGKQLRAPEGSLGKHVLCPGCQTRIQITREPAPTPRAETIPTACSCGHSFQAPLPYRGKLVRCPSCNQSVRVPTGESAPNPQHAAAFTVETPMRSSSPPIPQVYADYEVVEDGPPERPRKRRPAERAGKFSWMLVGIIGGVLGLIAVVVVVIVLVSSNSTMSVEGKVFAGQETLAGFGALRLEFRGNNQVVMFDAGQAARGPGMPVGRPIGRPFGRPVGGGGNGEVGGNWKQQGKSITCTFADCIYEGTLEGRTIRGNARFTNIMQAGQRWTFTVNYDGQNAR